jgi:NAD(P)-dependent dehydrogenase (short-subunit alcohol dehydrogenase family)
MLRVCEPATNNAWAVAMRAVVTGAASGIGRAVARRLRADAVARGESSRLLLVDRDGDALDRVAAELEGVPLVVDLAQPDAGERVAAAAREQLGGVDALISNAGIAPSGALLELSLEDWERTFAVNVRATWLLARACHPLLREASGALVATASIAAREPSPPIGAYSPSKAALAMLVRQLAHEWGPDGIRCNTVSPGTTHTGMTDATYSDPVRRADRALRLPLRRIGTPEEIAAAIAFLAGPDAAYITGTDLLVDGGLGTSLMASVRGLTPP